MMNVHKVLKAVESLFPPEERDAAAEYATELNNRAQKIANEIDALKQDFFTAQQGLTMFTGISYLTPLWLNVEGVPPTPVFWGGVRVKYWPGVNFNQVDVEPIIYQELKAGGVSKKTQYIPSLTPFTLTERKI